jgi:hypothetical protein
MPFSTASLSSGPEAQAAANSLEYTPQAPKSSFPGALFDYLQDATIANRFRATSGRQFEIGTITGRVGGSQTRQSGAWTVTTSYDSSEVRSYGYLAMQLERAVPQLVLDAKKNGSSIPMPIGGGQTLTLEGDFNKHFTLYCPRGYERDALYVFTPDLMALLIDETGDLDVEIVDDMLFVYATEPFDLGSAAVWERLGRIRGLVGAKALSQTDYYSDDRVADRAANRVSDDGRRLRQGFLGGSGTRLAVLVIGVFAVVIAFIAVVGFLVLSAL